MRVGIRDPVYMLYIEVKTSIIMAALMRRLWWPTYSQADRPTGMHTYRQTHAHEHTRTARGIAQKTQQRYLKAVEH